MQEYLLRLSEEEAKVLREQGIVTVKRRNSSILQRKIESIEPKFLQREKGCKQWFAACPPQTNVTIKMPKDRFCVNKYLRSIAYYFAYQQETRTGYYYWEITVEETIKNEGRVNSNS